MKVNVGYILVCTNARIARKNWLVLENEDWNVTLIDANRMYSEHNGLGDYWRVHKTFLEMNFIQL